jgi:hypothetical protein
MVDTQQRFLRRIYLLDIMSEILVEARYHKLHDSSEDYPALLLWKWDGRNAALTIK